MFLPTRIGDLCLLYGTYCSGGRLVKCYVEAHSGCIEAHSGCIEAHSVSRVRPRTPRTCGFLRVSTHSGRRSTGEMTTTYKEAVYSLRTLDISHFVRKRGILCTWSSVRCMTRTVDITLRIMFRTLCLRPAALQTGTLFFPLGRLSTVSNFYGSSTVSLRRSSCSSYCANFPSISTLTSNSLANRERFDACNSHLISLGVTMEGTAALE